MTLDYTMIDLIQVRARIEFPSPHQEHLGTHRPDPHKAKLVLHPLGTPVVALTDYLHCSYTRRTHRKEIFVVIVQLRGFDAKWIEGVFSIQLLPIG